VSSSNLDALDQAAQVAEDVSASVRENPPKPVRAADTAGGALRGCLSGPAVEKDEPRSVKQRSEDRLRAMSSLGDEGQPFTPGTPYPTDAETSAMGTREIPTGRPSPSPGPSPRPSGE